MKITKEWLREQGACGNGAEWFLKQRASKLDTVVMKLLKEDHSDWANWVIVRFMSHTQKVSYALFAAEQVLNLFEAKYPTDKRPREAIEAARRFVEQPTEENRNAANATYAYAAYAAANATNAADAANDAYANAAYAAANDANAAANATNTAYAADAAANAAYAAANAAANATNTAYAAVNATNTAYAAVNATYANAANAANANAAANAAYAADAAANAAYDADTRRKLRTKIVVYGLRLLAGGKQNV